MLGGAPDKRLTVVYCRVSSAGQKDDLASQVKEVGGGMNFKRKRFLDLLEDRAREQGCEFVFVNQESLSPEQEMVEDLLAIVHSFSCRLYGMHKYKKQIKDDYPQSKDPKELLS